MEAERRAQSMRFIHADADSSSAPTEPAPAAAAARPLVVRRGPRRPAQPARPFVRGGKKIGRNQPCPCGSGRKFKQCHGRMR